MTAQIMNPVPEEVAEELAAEGAALRESAEGLRAAVLEMLPAPAPGIPAGYVNRWPHSRYDLYHNVAGVEGPQWLVLRHESQEVLPASTAREGDAIGVHGLAA